MAALELHLFRTSIRAEMEDLWMEIASMKTKNPKSAVEYQQILDLVESKIRIVSKSMVNRFLEVLVDVLDVIFSQCNVQDVSRISQVCKLFHSRIDSEKRWKEVGLALWKQNIGLETAELEWVKGKVDFLTWKKMARFLNSTDHPKYRYYYDTGSGVLQLRKYKEGEYISSKSVDVDFKFAAISVGDFLEEGTGYGARYFKNGEIYVGNWLAWQLHGEGDYLYEDGARYIGGFKDSLKEGQGNLWGKNLELNFEGR